MILRGELAGEADRQLALCAASLEMAVGGGFRDYAATRTFNPMVVGSSPTRLIRKKPRVCGAFCSSGECVAGAA